MERTRILGTIMCAAAIFGCGSPSEPTAGGDVDVLEAALTDDSSPSCRALLTAFDRVGSETARNWIIAQLPRGHSLALTSIATPSSPACCETRLAICQALCTCPFHRGILEFSCSDNAFGC